MLPVRDGKYRVYECAEYIGSLQKARCISLLLQRLINASVAMKAAILEYEINQDYKVDPPLVSVEGYLDCDWLENPDETQARLLADEVMR